ncbi:MAG: ATP-binding protein [Defluviitaleaceae bacterium]|nr:ATP-binding protein [Defluviitaleaceae bacterium]MCL2276070.1 ATP-binding protein [Defluviitaleaceae bacterium]
MTGVTQMMQAVNQAAALLLASNNNGDIRKPLEAGLALVGRSVNASRVHIWKNEVTDGKAQHVYAYGWFNEENEKHRSRFDGLVLTGAYVDAWNASFTRSEIIGGGPITLLAKNEQEFLRRFDIKSVIILPLYAHDAFWGFFSVDDCENERTFGTEEVDILRSISLMMVNAISQNEMVHKMNEAHERSVLMLDTSPICAQIWDEDLNTIDCNEAGVRLYGFKNKQEYIDRFITSCSPEFQPDGRRSDEKAAELVHKAFKEGMCRFDWMQKMPDSDELIPADVTLVRSKYKDRNIVIGYTTDMREHIKNIKNIEELTRRRTEAEMASQTKSSFLASMSHEIRTPMNAILGITEILMENPHTTPEVSEGLDKIYNSGSLLLGIINDILDFSKIEAGKMDISPAQYSVAGLISDSAHLNAMRIDSKPIAFEIKADENLPAYLIGDELRIKQILNNMLSNAFKYTDSGTVTFAITHEVAECGIVLVLSVRDTGIGMTKVQLEKLYEEYTRFDEGQRRGVEGTGLGLTITHQLITLMHGTIHVESEYGEGSLFVVRLPQKTVDAQVLGKEEAENLRKFRVNYMGGKKRSQIVIEPMPYGSVLIVDDIQPNLYVAEGLMRPYGLKIETVSNGPAAIEKIKDGSVYDVIFIDHMMPVMDGVETAEEIRTLGYTAPLIMFTANAISGQAEYFMQRGFDDFISKPIDTRQLNRVLNKYVRDRHSPEVQEIARKQMGNILPVAAQAKSPVAEALRASQTIDVAGALDALDGMHEVYEKVVKLSARLMPNTLVKLEGLLAGNDFSHFAIEVHGIKGVARSIGATGVATMAGRLEIAAFNKGKDFCIRNFPDFKESVLALAQELNDAISHDVPEIKEAIDPAEALEKIKEARQLAEGYDAMTALETVNPLIHHAFTEEIEVLLEKAVFDLEEFDCEGAVIGLQKIEDLLAQ